jgi:hypothetical protein
VPEAQRVLYATINFFKTRNTLMLNPELLDPDLNLLELVLLCRVL